MGVCVGVSVVGDIVGAVVIGGAVGAARIEYNSIPFKIGKSLHHLWIWKDGCSYCQGA